MATGGTPVALVTGGSGFLGTFLARRLLAEGQAVRVLDPVRPPAEIAPDVEWVDGSVLEPDSVAAACRGADVVYHAAALVPLSKAGRRFGDVNTFGTALVADTAIELGVRRFVHISSSAVYDPAVTAMPVTEDTPLRPVGEYGRSKAAAEDKVREAGVRGLRWTIIRPRTIVDEGRGGIFQILFDWASAGKRLYMLGDGSNTFQLVSAVDLADACVRAASVDEAEGEIFNVGAAEFGTLGQLMEGLAGYAGAGSRVAGLNAGLARTVLGSLDVLHLSPLAEWHYRTMDKPFWCDNTKAQRLMDWVPRDTNRSLIERSYDYYVAHRSDIDGQSGTTHRTSPRQGILRVLRRFS